MCNWRAFITIIVVCLTIFIASDSTAKGSRTGRRVTHSTTVRAPRAPRVRSYTSRTPTRAFAPRASASPRRATSQVKKAPTRTPRSAHPRSTSPRVRAAAPRATAASRTFHPRASTRVAAVAVALDSRGRLARSESAKRAFERQTGFPNGRPGYVVDHIRPLACGGADAPSNMQWQSVAAAKAKDRVERKGC